MSIKKIKNLVATHWRVILSALVAVVSIGLLLWWRLGTLVPGVSEIELQTIQNSQSLQSILNNPVFLPFLIPLWVLQKLGLESITALRSVGSLYGVMSIALLFIVLRQWQTTRIAVLGTTLFATSSWFLHSSRIAAPYIMFVVMILFLAAYLFWLHNSKYRKLSAAVAITGLSMSLYIPGFIWFVIAIGIWRKRDVFEFAKKLPLWLTVLLGVGKLIIIAPLIYAVAKDSSIAMNVLAFPTAFEPVDWLRRLAVIPAFILARGPEDPVFNLGRLPLIDIFTAGIFIIGAYSSYLRFKLLRSQFLVISAVITIVLTALNGTEFLASLLPVVYIIATAGLTLLLQQWFTVFPSNPIARSIGVIILTIAVGLTGFYHVNRYFVAWSGNPDTRNSFSHQISEDL